MKDSFLKKTAYNLLDWVTLKKGVARKINGTKVRFPARWFRYFPGDYESENYAFLKQYLKPGMQVLDIGAHIGLFSVVCSRLTENTGKIICFEPTPGTFSILKETLKLNHCDNVIAVQAAVSDKNGTATFYTSDADEGCNSNSLVRNRPEDSLTAYEVKLVTIDSTTADHSLKPSLIKIDAEGAELDVLKGGIKTFKEHKPVLILGLHPVFISTKKDSLKEIWDLIKESNYRIIYNGSEMGEADFVTQTDLFDVHLMPA